MSIESTIESINDTLRLKKKYIDLLDKAVMFLGHFPSHWGGFALEIRDDPYFDITIELKEYELALKSDEDGPWRIFSTVDQNWGLLGEIRDTGLCADHLMSFIEGYKHARRSLD